MKLVFAVTVLVVLVSVSHLALYDRLVRKPRWSPWLRWAVTGLGGLMAVGVLVSILGARFFPREVMRPLGWVTYTWMGCVFFLGLAGAAAEAGLWVPRGLRRMRKASEPRQTDAREGPQGGPSSDGTPGPTRPDSSTRPAGDMVDPSRRRVLAGGVAAVSAAASGAAFRSAQDLTFPEVEVRLPRWPKALDGLTLVQLSDVHIGHLLGNRWLEGVVREVNRMKPDLVVITGDLVDGSVKELAPHVAPLARVRARIGRYFVTGNHDYYSGADPWCEQMRAFGYRVLRNEVISIEDGSARFQLAGIDDFYATGSQGVGARMAPSVDPDLSTVLLAHQPRSISDAVAMGAELQISGHTHGGQIYPVAELVRLVTPYVAGLYRHDPRTQIYVSRGTGFVGPPMRFLAPAEVTRLVLVSA